MSSPSPSTIDESGSLQSLQVGCYAIYGLAITVVALRLYTRTRIVGCHGWDDYFIIVAALSSTAIVVTVPFMFNLGIGLHISTLTNYQIFYGRRAAWVSQVFYYFALGFIKCSIVALYIRLISTRSHLMILYTLGTLIMAHALITSIITAHMCSPVSIIWGPTFPLHCINILTFNYFNAAFHILTDLLLAALPVPVLLHLHLSQRKKIALVTVFGAGLLTIAATVARQIYNFIALTGPDFSWNWAPTELVTNLEVNLGLICASVPALQTLFKSKTRPTFSYTKNSSSAHSKMSTLNRSGGGIREIERDIEVGNESGGAAWNEDPWVGVGVGDSRSRIKTEISSPSLSTTRMGQEYGERDGEVLNSAGVVKMVETRVEYRQVGLGEP